jgi:Na+:H+ antiporter, NhaA family
MKKILQRIRLDTFSGFLLILASSFAIYLTNSPAYSQSYTSFLARHIGSLCVKEWICEVLMAFFFLSVAIDLKKEFLSGSLSKKGYAALPLVGAFGGMLIPALVFLLINVNHPENWRAFAVPCATDIVFAVAIFNMVMGSKTAQAAKMFLLALAIFDDLGAILLIATCYSKHINLVPMTLVLLGIIMLALYNKNNTKKISAYLCAGILIWVGLSASGIHTTIAGAIVGLFLPTLAKDSFLHKAEKVLKGSVSLVILPLFAFSACNIDLSAISFKAFSNSITLGVFLGLFIGKQIGVFFFTWITVKMCAIKMHQLSWWELYCVSVFAGIGFTMSLFIGELSFTDKESLNFIKTGLALASVLSVLWSVILVQIKNLLGVKC